MSAGKGSKPRPFSVSYETYSDNFNNIFGKKKVSLFPRDNPTWENEAKTISRKSKATLRDPAVESAEEAYRRSRIDNKCTYCGGSGTLNKDYQIFDCPWCCGKGKHE